MITNKEITTPNNGQCLTFVQFDNYAKGRLTDEESAAVRQHIETCSDCREVYEALKDVDVDFLEEATAELTDRIDARVADMERDAAMQDNAPKQDAAPKQDNAVKESNTIEMENANKGRIVKMVFKYAAAAAIAGVCIWFASRYVGNVHTDGNTVADDLVQQDATQGGSRHRQTEVPQTETQSNAQTDVAAQPETPASTTNQTANPQQPEKTDQTATNTKTQGKTDTPKSDVPQKSDNATKTDALQDEFEAGVVTRGINIAKPSTDKVANTDKVEKLMLDAERFINEKNYTVAKAVLERIVDDDPDNNEAVKKLAICDFNLHNYGQSLKNLRRVTPKDETEKREIDGLIDECLKRISY